MIKFSEKPYICAVIDRHESDRRIDGIGKGFALIPFQTLFVFCNRNCNRIKILEWDGDGFGCILRVGTGRLTWPAIGEEAVMNLNVKDHLFNRRCETGKEDKRKEVFERQIL